MSLKDGIIYTIRDLNTTTIIAHNITTTDEPP